MLSLSQLSERGVKHLEADLKYLSNVFHALDLAAPPILDHLTLLAGFGTEEAVNHLAQETTTGEWILTACLFVCARLLASEFVRVSRVKLRWLVVNCILLGLRSTACCGVCFVFGRYCGMFSPLACG